MSVPQHFVMRWLKRRGLRYVAYYASGVLWPQGAYRYLWGPRAPALARACWYGAGVFSTRPWTAGSNLPAQTADLHRLLAEHGFRVTVYRYPGFARDLLVGHPAS